MKRNLLLFATALFFSVGLFAQVTLTIGPSPTFGNADLDDLGTNPIDVPAKATLTNISGETRTFKWTREVISAPEEWAIAICDINFCYDADTMSAIFELAGGQSGIIDVHVYPSGSLISLEGAVPGEGIINITIVEEGNEDNTVTGEYKITVRGDSIASSLTVLEIASLQLFPNPALDYFEVKGPQGVAYLTIYNLLGSQIQQFTFSEGQKYDLSHLSKGLYLVALLDEDSQLLKTLRLQKQ